MRKQLPFLIATVFGFLMLARFFMPSREMERFETVIVLYARIIGGFAMVLGIASLVRVNWIRIQRRMENWPFSVVTIGGFVVMFLVGAFGGLFLVKPVTLELAFADGARGTAEVSDDGLNLTLARAESKLTLKRDGEAGGKGAAAFPGTWRVEPPAPSVESGATESAPAAAAAAPAPPPAELSITDAGSGTLLEGEGAEAKSAAFTWAAPKPRYPWQSRWFAAGFSRERNKALDWLFQWVYTPMDATIFSLLAFYIASAAFRSMRARDATSALLLAAAVLVMLGRAPHTAHWWDLLVHPKEGGMWWSLVVEPFNGLREAHPWLAKHHFASLGQLTEWVMAYPNTAAKRAVLFGAGLAALAQSIRILVGLERPYMAGTGD